MSLFGNVETPRAERPEPAGKQLTELSLRVYGARLEPEQNVVRLHAEAKTAFADGTTGAGVSVGFFLNGRRLSDIASDDYGLALFDGNVPADRFRWGDNELVVRAKGFSREISQTVVLAKPPPVLPPPKPQPPAPVPPPEPKFTFQKLATEVNDGSVINVEARRLVEVAHDYEKAVEILERLPSGLRDAVLFQKAGQLRDRVRELDKQLADARHHGSPEEVCTVALLLAELLPNNEDLARLIATLPKPPPKFTNSIGMSFVLVPHGRFVMGEEEDAHSVRITQPFHLGVFPVTQAVYQHLMNENPSAFHASGCNAQAVYGQDTSRFPVESVSWNDAQEFCRKLSKSAKETEAGRCYRLPTEAEWEYACRAGTTTAYAFGDSLSLAAANFDGHFGHPSTVGSYRPNAFGLCDMHGNVWEWCEDMYDENAYESRRGKTTTEPLVTRRSGLRVLRGGSWYGTSLVARSASRTRDTPDNRDSISGFRVVCVVSP